ncbi:MAG: hypothetical protein FJZ58_03255 [Chlamydiae bacterium]|nr:hypothetical protein [Chlamydiota bacterium]
MGKIVAKSQTPFISSNIKLSLQPKPSWLGFVHSLFTKIFPSPSSVMRARICRQSYEKVNPVTLQDVASGKASPLLYWSNIKDAFMSEYQNNSLPTDIAKILNRKTSLYEVFIDASSVRKDFNTLYIYWISSKVEKTLSPSQEQLHLTQQLYKLQASDRDVVRAQMGPCIASKVPFLKKSDFDAFLQDLNNPPVHSFLLSGAKEGVQPRRILDTIQALS